MKELYSNRAVVIGTIPVICLPQKLILKQGRELLIVPGTEKTIIVHDEERSQSKELFDMSVDIIWCCHTDRETLVMGSAYGQRVYFLDIDTLEVRQVLSLRREEDEALAFFRSFVIHGTPDGEHVIVVSELMFVIASWSGQVMMQHEVQLNDSLVAFDNTSLTFEDKSSYGTIIYLFPSQHGPTFK